MILSFFSYASYGFLSYHRFNFYMFWLNISRSTGAWKLHKENCRFCTPKETSLKGLNELKHDGGWIEVDSYNSAYEYYKLNHHDNEYWQPCKVCKPEL